jgi:hypothetical protein
MDAAFDRFAMFVSADFFVDFWHVVIGSVPRPTAIERVQSAGRNAVNDLMGSEDCYWNIDFSLERQAASEALYFKSLRINVAEDARFEEALRVFCTGERVEQVSSDFALSFIYRAVKDTEFRVGAGVLEGDAVTLGACLPSELDELDGLSVVDNWLRSDTFWDLRIKNLTPDVPDFVATEFLGLRRQAFQLPTLISNLRLVLDPPQFGAIIRRVQSNLTAALSSQPNLKIPSALAVAG